MAQINAAIAAELANGARDVLRQAGAVLTGNQGDYIANGEPSSIYGRIQQETARRACRAYADEPTMFQGRASVLAENACRPYLANIGYGSPPTIEKPFEGGQCDEIYLAQIIVSEDGAVTNDFTRRVHGPIGGVRILPISGTFRVQILARGINVGVATCGPLTPGLYQWRDTGLAGNAFNDRTVALGSITPCDGTDQCGNVPPDILPPGPPAVPNPPTGPYNPGPGIDIDIDVTINPDGGFDVDFGVGPVTIDPFGDDDGEGGDPGGGGGGPANPPGDIGNPGGGGSTGPGGDTSGEAPPNSVLVGVKIDIVEPLPDVSRYDDQVLRGVGYVYMGVPGNLALEPSGVALRTGQFVFAQLDNLTAWEVRANTGYNLSVTPYYRALEPEEV